MPKQWKSMITNITVCFLTFVLFTDAFCQRQVNKALAKPLVTAILDESGAKRDEIVLRHGDQVTILAQGRNLHLVKKAQLFQRNTRIPQADAEVKILQVASSQIQLSLQIKTTRFQGSGFYLQLQDTKENQLADTKINRITLTTSPVKVAAGRTVIPGGRTPVQTGIKPPSRTTPGRTPAPGTAARQTATRNALSPRTKQFRGKAVSALAKDGSYTASAQDEFINFMEAVLEEHPHSDIMGLIFEVFKASIDEANEDKRYFLEKLAEMNEIAEAQAEYLQELTEAMGGSGGCDDEDINEFQKFLVEVTTEFKRFDNLGQLKVKQKENKIQNLKTSRATILRKMQDDADSIKRKKSSK